MILVDTSVWIDFLHGHSSAQAAFLARLIEEEENFCTCGIVLTEVLQGIRGENQARRTEHLLSDLIYLPTRRSAHLLAAHIYRSARRRGVTICRSVDYTIAACAIEAGTPLLHRDRDFEEIARGSDLEIADTLA